MTPVYPYIRFPKVTQPDVPPTGFVDLVYDRESGALAIRESDGATHSLGGQVTNSTVNTAISYNAAASRSALGLGTAATTKATAYATAAQGISATGGPLRVACVGTSITYVGSALDTNGMPRIHDLTSGHPGWLEHLSNHRVRLVRRSGVNESLTDKTFGYSGFGLTGLTNGASGVYPLDNAIASGAEVLVLEGGINDIAATSAATVLARIAAYWTKAVTSGLRVVALNVLPTGGQAAVATGLTAGQTYEICSLGTTGAAGFQAVGAATGLVGDVFVATGAATGSGTATCKSSATAITNKATIAEVNAALPALAASLGVTLIDTHSVATLSDGLSTVETTWDGVHPSPAYAHRIAVLINAQLASLYANRAQEMIVPAAASGLWITTNNSPSQATIPTGWAKSGTFTDTWSAVTDADGTKWQRVRIQQGGTALSSNSIYIRASTGFAAGDIVRFSCRIRAVDGAAFANNEIGVMGRAYDTTWRYFRAISGGANLGLGDYDPVTGLFVSPPFVIPASTSMVDALLDFYPGDVTVDIRQFGVFKVLANL